MFYLLTDVERAPPVTCTARVRCQWSAVSYTGNISVWGVGGERPA